MPKNTVLLICEYFPYNSHNITGGVERRTFDMAIALAKTHKVTVISSSFDKTQINNTSLDVIRTPWTHKHTSSPTFFGFLFRILFIIWSTIRGIFFVLQNRTFVVEGENFIAYLPTFIVSVFGRSKRAITYHETWIGEFIEHKGLFTGFLGELYERIILALPWHSIISVSEFTAERLRQHAPKQNIVTIHNSINFKNYNRDKKRTNTIFTVSRLAKSKRVDLLMNAAIHMESTLLKKKYSVIIAGDGAEYQHLFHLAFKQNYISLLGRISDLEMKAFLSSSHVFVSCSELEGFGLTVIEALASGCVCVLSDLPVYKEIVGDSKNVLFFKQGDEASLEQALMEALSRFFVEDKFIQRYDIVLLIEQWKKELF